jgi:hypothetical protein
MKDDEKTSALKEAGGGMGLLLLVAGAILVIGGLFYFGLG